ncbi:MAG: RNA-binding protein [Candidatus Methanomethylicota archaeon]|uniref:Exosome complex component Csl4 n=1 Tax=Thermoproteota archaeon TaxID=2056631 RepID=A0A497F2V3_9CREN|nr:MAG: RNA-binding protein [Candidatus Verstraetearchaeota archaeon]RLE53552.1 MAG: RNA-binding protein [Candidatus Verstraetearchaeota archaeon]
MSVKSTKSLAVPGDKLSVIEEYLPGDGTYEENGAVYAKFVGKIEVNGHERRISIKQSSRKVVIPVRDDIVIGQVQALKEDLANIRILSIEGKPRLSGHFSAVLHISQISRGRVKSLDSAIAVGDIIRAKVIADWPPYQLTIADRELGVIYALCLKCGEPLILREGKLYCRKCKQFEERKVSSRYISIGG